jgi:YVTN family beta-propeller protein
METSIRRNPINCALCSSAISVAKLSLCHSVRIAALWAGAIAGSAIAAGQVPTGGLISRQAVVVNPDTGKAYVVETDQDSIAVINGATHAVSSVRVGKAPVAVVVNVATDKVYVANHGSGDVSVLDGESNVLLATIKVGSLPYSMAVDTASNTVYVSNVFSQIMTMIEGDTNRTSTMKIGSWDAMLPDPKRGRVYLLGYESADLTILDVKTKERSRLPMGKMHLWGIALNESNDDLLVTRIGNGDIVEHDGESNQSAVIKTGEYPCAVAINARTNRAYVVNYLDDSVTVIDTGRKQVIATIAVGERPEAVALDETADRIYVANSRSNSVTVIDGKKNRAVDTLKTGSNPFAIVVDSKNRMAYVANTAGQPFTQLDLSSR